MNVILFILYSVALLGVGIYIGWGAALNRVLVELLKTEKDSP